MEKSNEIELVTRYIEGSGYRVKDVRYFEDHILYMGAGNYYVGVNQGHVQQHQFFYGNISLQDEMQGVINLANRNEHVIIFSTLLYGGVAIETARHSFCVNSGLDLLGDGNYIGSKRLYGVGCNQVDIGVIGCGAALIAGGISFTGLIWTII